MVLVSVSFTVTVDFLNRWMSTTNQPQRVALQLKAKHEIKIRVVAVLDVCYRTSVVHVFSLTGCT